MKHKPMSDEAFKKACQEAAATMDDDELEDILFRVPEYAKKGIEDAMARAKSRQS